MKNATAPEKICFIFDDIDYANIGREKKIHLLDVSETCHIRILYKTAMPRKNKSAKNLISKRLTENTKDLKNSKGPEEEIYESPGKEIPDFKKNSKVKRVKLKSL